MAAPVKHVDLHALLTAPDRDYVVKNNGEHVAVNELLRDRDTIIGLYFSAHWCPPCRGFTPRLANIYNELKAAGKKFEVVFISSDQDEPHFQEYHNEMPWLAMPYSDRQAKNTAAQTFEVRGIPTLVFLDVDGNAFEMQGRSKVMEEGAAGYPYKPDPEKLARQAEEKRRLDDEMSRRPKRTKDHRHEHQLELLSTVYGGGYGCDGCGRGGQGWVYHCGECNWDLHPGCVQETAAPQ